MTKPESPGNLERSRREKLQRIRELGFDPWGGRFDDRPAIGAIRQRADEIRFRRDTGETIDLPDLTAPTELDFRGWMSEQGKGELTGPTVRAAGRVVLLRDTGRLKFIDIRDQTGQIQLFVGKKQVGEQAWQLSDNVDLGDLIGVDGELRTNADGGIDDLRRGPAFSRQITGTATGKTPWPDRSRTAAADALPRSASRRGRPAAVSRSDHDRAVRSAIRSARRGFCEIEGPTLHAIAGGAAARPFTTHHNALNIDLFLRIALELHLKRLLVGGMERVFELGRVYRNEGISPRHNPEFTMLEVYEAYGNYETMMDLTEAVIVDAIEALGRGTRLEWGEKAIDFTPPFARRTYEELFRQHTGIDPQDGAEVARLAPVGRFRPRTGIPM